MAESLRLEFTCTRQEQSRAEGLTARQVLGRGSKWGSRVVFVVLLAIGIGALVIHVEPAERLTWFGIFGGIWVVTFLGMRWIKGRGPGLTRVWLLPGIVRVITPKVDRQFEPSELSLLESEELFMLRNRAGTIMIPVPKRVFADADEQERFRALLATEAARA